MLTNYKIHFQKQIACLRSDINKKKKNLKQDKEKEKGSPK